MPALGMQIGLCLNCVVKVMFRHDVLVPGRGRVHRSILGMVRGVYCKQWTSQTLSPKP